MRIPCYFPCSRESEGEGRRSHLAPVFLPARHAGLASPAAPPSPDFGPQRAALHPGYKRKAGGTPALRLLREAVEQAVAAGGDEVGLAAAAGLVRRGPGALEFVVGAAAAVDVAEFGLAEFAARPVVAGQVHVAGERSAVGLRAGQGVVIGRRIAETRNPGAALGERVVGGELVVGAVPGLSA